MRQTAKIIPIRPDIKPFLSQKHKGEVPVWVPKSERKLVSEVLFVLAASKLRGDHLRYYVNQYARELRQQTGVLDSRP